MSIPEFLSALQSVKKELLKPERATLQERADSSRRLQTLLLRDSAKITALDPLSTVFSTEFYRTQILEPAARAFERVAGELTPEQDSRFFPSGVIALGIHSPFLLRLFCERAAPALGAGNVLLFKPRTGQEPLAEHLKSLVLEAGFAEGSLAILPTTDDLTGFLFQHPGIRGVSWFDPSFAPELLGGASSLLEKKWQIHRGGKSTALVLADADLDQAADGIVRAIYEGWGTSSWNVSRILVLDSVLKDFTGKLIQAAQKHRFDEVIPAARSALELKRTEWVRKLQNEQARLLAPDASIALLENVSNCTEAHQIELQSPIAFLMSVKYPHEMQKWVNNLSNSMGVQIWASDDRAAKLAAKLETARVWTRGWIEQDSTLSYGVKASVFGGSQNETFGGFYAERRVF